MATLIGNSNSNILIGGAFDDFIDGLGGADNLAGGANEDTLEGGSGNDVIIGGRGRDLIRGEGDNDELQGDQNADTIDGGPGIDTVFYRDGIIELFVNLNGLCKGGDAEGDRLSNIENFDSDQYNGAVNVIGTDFANFFRSGGKDDVFVGLGGNDTFFGSAGADEMHGDGGIDTLDYSTVGSAVIVDLQFGNAQGGADGDEFFDMENLNGSPFADTLYGDEGVNVLNGNSGVDHMEGRIGNDIYREPAADGATDEILDQSGALDRLEMRLDDIVTIVRVGNDLRIFGDGVEEMRILDHFVAGSAVERFFDLGGEIGEVVLSVDLVGGDLPGIISGTRKGETLDGRGGNDVLYANGGHDSVLGGDGDDRLHGNRGRDTIEGGNGDDTIGGGDGRDVLIGGLGADVMNGGAGRDTFAYTSEDDSPPGDTDTILGFRPGVDELDFSALPGQLAFVGGAAFSAAGQIRYTSDGDDTFVQVNLDGNLNTVELEVRLIANIALDVGDFVL
jgi:Ca2+-binding RTX toxin-like protein